MDKAEFTVAMVAKLAATREEDSWTLRHLTTWRCLLFHRFTGLRAGCASCQFWLTRLERAASDVLHEAGLR